MRPRLLARNARRPPEAVAVDDERPAQPVGLVRGTLQDLLAEPPRPGQHPPVPRPADATRSPASAVGEAEPIQRRRHRLSVTVPIPGEFAHRVRLRHPMRLQELLDEPPIIQRERRQRPRLPGQQSRIMKRAAQNESRHRLDVRRHYKSKYLCLSPLLFSLAYIPIYSISDHLSPMPVLREIQYECPLVS